MDEDLKKLSGMRYKNGYFTSEYWEKKTGINPLKFSKYIKISKTGLCIWTNEAEKLFQENSDQVGRNWVAVGCANK